jgi:hypothetical protein
MVVVGAVVLTQVPEPARAAPGNGIVLTEFGANEVGSSVALQPDGKIVVAGTSGNVLALVRYNADGSLDTSFGNGGQIVGGPTRVHHYEPEFGATWWRHGAHISGD